MLNENCLSAVLQSDDGDDRGDGGDDGDDGG